jgi:hypothetical protein
MYEYGTLKSVEVILRRGMGKREDNGGDELNQGTLYTYLEMPQQNILYNCYALIKMFLQKNEWGLTLQKLFEHKANGLSMRNSASRTPCPEFFLLNQPFNYSLSYCFV